MSDTCPQCGSEFTCDIESFRAGGHCWCTQLPRVMAIVPEAKCLCPGCLKKAIASEAGKAAG